MTKRRIGIGSSVVFALMIACGDDENSGGPDCEAICERIEAASCSHAAPDCVAACREDRDTTKVSCESKLDALGACFEDARFTCDADGIPVAKGCKDKLDAWLECNGGGAEPDMSSGHHGGGLPDDADSQSGGAQAGSGSQGSSQGGSGSQGGSQAGSGSQGGGSQAGSGSQGGGAQTPEARSCEPDADADSCDVCLAGSCCAELSACGTSCLALFACMESCDDSDDACFERCFDQYPEGQTQAVALSSCVDQSCQNECALGDDSGAEPSSGDAADLSSICLEEQVPEGYCDGTGKAVAHDCPVQKPFDDCVLSPTGAANVYCCDR